MGIEVLLDGSSGEDFYVLGVAGGAAIDIGRSASGASGEAFSGYCRRFPEKDVVWQWEAGGADEVLV